MYFFDEQNFYFQLDRERGNYGVKEVALAKMYSEIMMLPKQEGERLKYYKNPQRQPAGAPAGDFVAVLMAVMDKRCRTDASLSVGQVNSYLDQLAKGVDNKEKKTTLAKLLNETTLGEQKWIVRIILKDLKLGIGHETILKNYHPDAISLYNVTSDLKEVLQELRSSEHRVGGTEKFRMFMPIRPMLAEKISLKSLSDFVKRDTLLVETKLDGERIQCHVSSEVVKFFSRNSLNYTHIYGPKMTRIVRDNVNCRACILDGEMVVWDSKTNSIVPFGQNKTVAQAEDTVIDGKQLCYMVFDILYVQGNKGEEANLMNATLRDRKMVLNRVVRSIPHVFEVVQGEETDKLEIIYDAFNKSIARNEEGIILKQLTSIYTPAERTSTWIKLKGEYIDNVGDTLDLLVIGGYFGSARRSANTDWTDHVTVFLLGVRKYTNKDNPKLSLILPFSKVGTGYTFEELDIIRAKLKQEWRPYDTRMPPQYFGEWIPAMTDKPDVYVEDPSKSIVFEIRAAEIVCSDQYPVKHTLRFPRVMKIRYDKSWDDTLTLDQLHKTVIDFEQGGMRLKKKNKKVEENVDGDEFSLSNKRAKLKRTAEMRTIIVPHMQDTDVSEVKRRTRIFEGLEFYIANISGESCKKADLERIIVENGGKKVQNYLVTTTHILAEKLDFKVANIIQSTNLPIIHYCWVLKCNELGKVVDLTPKYMLHTPSTLDVSFNIIPYRIKIGILQGQFGQIQ
eukprot:TRINITY_DN15277_c0_g1_i1.p1 TRINITY_DN15277_c0_g1~~TRINITY_DN15277_c0_g1_i1.p1  ORF type:complete len:732 (-),score=68.46 TRINITY_DN15277_c0_g1_i1:510-2705(-)